MEYLFNNEETIVGKEENSVSRALSPLSTMFSGSLKLWILWEKELIGIFSLDALDLFRKTKMKNCLNFKGRKHYGKRRKCCLSAVSPFSTMLFFFLLFSLKSFCTIEKYLMVKGWFLIVFVCVCVCVCVFISVHVSECQGLSVHSFPLTLYHIIPRKLLSWGFLKSLWVKQEMLETNIFWFFHDISYRIKWITTHLKTIMRKCECIQIHLVWNVLNLNKSKTFSPDKGYRVRPSIEQVGKGK